MSILKRINTLVIPSGARNLPQTRLITLGILGDPGLALRDPSPARLPDQDDNVRPRKNSAALMRRFPSSWTSVSDKARSDVATTSSRSFRKISPGFPRRSTIDAAKIFRLRPENSVNAPGHGL